MAGEAQIVETVFLILRLLGADAELARLSRIFPFLAPQPEEDALKKIDEANKPKTRKRPDDSRHVLKVSDAIGVVEKNFRDAQFLWTIFKGLLGSLVGGQSIPDAIADQLADQMRAAALSQMNPERARSSPGRTRKQ